MARQLLLHRGDGHRVECHPTFHRQRRGDARALTGHRTASHVARGRVADAVTTDGAARDQQVLDPLGQHAAVRDVHVAPGGGQNQNAVAVDEFGVNADAVLKARLLAHIVFGQVVDGVDLAGVADANGHAEIAQTGVFTAGREALERFDGEHGLRAAFDLLLRHAVGVGAITTGQVHQVHVGQLAAVEHGTPSAGDGRQVGGDDAGLQRLGKGFFEEGREHLVLFARGLDLPFAGGPVGVGLGVFAHAGHEAGLVDAGEVEHHRSGLHLLHRGGVRDGACAVRDVGVARGVDDAVRQDRFAPGLALDDHPFEQVTVHDGGHDQSVQHGVDARLLHQAVGHQFEAFGVDLVRQRLRLWAGRAHGLGALFKLPADAHGLDGFFVAVPGQAFHTDHRDVAAEATKALNQGDRHPGARRGQRRRQAPGAGAQDQHITLVNHLDGTSGFLDECWGHGGLCWGGQDLGLRFSGSYSGP